MKKRWSILFFVTTLFFFPVVLLILHSFSVAWSYGSLFPTEFSFRAWHVLLNEPKLLRAIGTSFAVGAIVVFINLIVGYVVGKTLAHEEFVGKDVFESLLLFPIIIPSLAIAMGIHIAMIKWGLADSLIGVSIVHLIPTIPYSIKMFRSSFDRIGLKWEEQAKSLGASTRTIFYTIYLPQLIPTVRAVMFLIFVISLSQYALTAIIGGGNVITLAMIYFPYFSTVDESVMASFSILFAILPLIFLIVVEGFIRVFVPYNNRQKR